MVFLVVPFASDFRAVSLSILFLILSILYHLPVEKYSQIEHENRMLLEKVSYIMTHDTIDNRAQVRTKSLNAPYKKQKALAIMRENQVRSCGRKGEEDREGASTDVEPSEAK